MTALAAAAAAAGCDVTTWPDAFGLVGLFALIGFIVWCMTR